MGKKDEYHLRGMRKKMVDNLTKKGITDQKVLSAMLKIPRHFFIDTAFSKHIYEDQAFPIGSGQTISSPFTVAYQSQLLSVEKRNKILEIGTGSGYQAAILADMGGRVYTVERQAELYKNTSEFLKEYSPGVRCFYRDGFLGLPEFAPFDRIIVTAGASEIPEALKEQLTIGGKLVIPVGEKTQRMICITRRATSKFHVERLENFRFVPFLKGKV